MKKQTDTTKCLTHAGGYRAGVGNEVGNMSTWC